ncbi:hypothetical protein [Naasia sp. SYSU D00948]|uniref:hypothetical protein n=1 Tax=Naasia sp. SYSU D00948 TaxID=2817379 RepID=UPI001B314D8E|nr:hypothetical protein [Naasia sp. SYSU D00948]
MPGRVLAGTLTTIVLTAVLLFLGAGLLALGAAASPGAAFLDDGPRAVLTFVGLPFAIWAVVLVLVDVLVRNRTVTVRLLIGMGVTLIVAALTLGFWVVFGLSQGGWAAFVMAIAAVYVALFCVAGLVSLALAHLVLFRRRPAVGVAAA